MFVVLHALNFVLILGGAVGGAIQALVISCILSVSSNQKKSTGVRALSCSGIWILSTIVQVILVLMIFSAV